MDGRFRPLLLLLISSVLFLATIPLMSHAATTTPLTADEAIEVLRSYSIVRGNPSGNLGLEERLTRAQAATLFVRALGSADLASLVAGFVPFADSKNHWASGEIALIERMGLMRGDGNGAFRPDSDITYAEVLTVLLRMVNQEPPGPWEPLKVWEAASRAGIVPAGVQPDDPALRGEMFWSMGNAIARIPLAGGQTLLQQHVDSTPPKLLVDTTSRVTQDQSATISGSTEAAFRVTVAGKPAALDATTGRFQHTVALTVGVNAIPVEAYDHAGNQISSVVSIERQSTATRVKIGGPGILPVYTSTPLTITALDKDNRPVSPTTMTVTLTGDVATFDPVTETLTTGARTGAGTLTLKSGSVTSRFSFKVSGPSDRTTQLKIVEINGGRSLAIGKETTVQVQTVDASGKLVTDDYGRMVALSLSGIAGQVTPAPTAVTRAGVATFTLLSSTQSAGTVSAISPGLTAVSVPIQVLTSTRVVLTSTAASLRPDGVSTATIRAILQDDTGRAIPNQTGAGLTVHIGAAGTDGYLSSSALVIPQNGSSSGTVTFHAGITMGTATITGQVQAAGAYSVQTLSLPVTDALPGAKLQVVYPTARQIPGDQGAAITVRVVDAQNRLVNTGSYAFQFTVSTSNNEPVRQGLPEGVELTFAGSAYQPISDPYPVGSSLRNPNAVVGRTHLGVATLNLKYDKSGTVTITPLLIGPASSAFHPTTGFGLAAASAAMTAESGAITYAANPARVELSATSALGHDKPGGAVGPGGSLTLRARVVDAGGRPIPGYSEAVTLTRISGGNSVTSIAGLTKKATVDGVADFPIQASSITGFDTYRAVVGALTSQPIAVSVRNVRPATPTIAAIRGVTTGEPSPSLGYVGPSADYMEIQLHNQVPPNPGEPHNWVSVQLFYKGEQHQLVSGAVVDLLSDLPVFRVPKSAIRPGISTYEVVINNGTGHTARSPDLGLSQAVNAAFSSAYHLSAALYDAPSGQLTLTASGLASDGKVFGNRLRLVKGSHEFLLGSSDITLLSLHPTRAVIQLGALRPDPDLFHGDVQVRAESGWYTSNDAAHVAMASQTTFVKPMAVITHATLDQPEKRLTLHGQGLAHGVLALEAVKVGSVPLRPGTSASSDRLLSVTDGQAVIALSEQTLASINSLAGAGHITTDAGWIHVTSGGTTYAGAALGGTSRQVHLRAVVTSVQYDRTTLQLTLRGSGFTGGLFAPDKLSFRSPGSSDAPWRPNANSVVSLGGDTTVTIQFDQDDATAFQAAFDGRNVFLNTEDGWLTDAQGRTAAPLPVNSVLFSVPVH